jgi:lysophospholipid acyltransferase
MQYLLLGLAGSYVQTTPWFFAIKVPIRKDVDEGDEKYRTRLLHLWQIFVSSMIGIAAYGFLDMLQLITFLCVTFVVFHAAPSKRLRVGLIWSLSFLWLSYLHLIRPPLAQLHLSGSVMLLVIKLTTYAAQDVTKPNFYPFIAWVMFIPSFLVGPTLTYDEYLTWVAKVVEKETRSPKIHVEVMVYYALQLLVFGLSTFLIHYFPLSALYAEDLSMRPETWTRSFIHTWIALWSIRCKYYFAWTFSEFMFRVSGADKCVSHGGVNVRPFNVESATSLYDILHNWNICTDHWLKTVVHDNVLASYKSKVAAVVATNMVSAFWHGFAPGYYITFLTAGCCSILGYKIHKLVVPRLGPHMQFYKTVMFVWTMIISVTFTIPFQVQTWSATWACWSQISFVGHWLVLITAVLLFLYSFEAPSSEVSSAESMNSEALNSEASSVVSTGRN